MHLTSLIKLVYVLKKFHQTCQCSQEPEPTGQLWDTENELLYQPTTNPSLQKEPHAELVIIRLNKTHNRVRTFLQKNNETLKSFIPLGIF